MNYLTVRIRFLIVVLIFAFLKVSASEPWPGYLDLDGVSRYVKIPQSNAFSIPAGGTMTITLKVLQTYNENSNKEQMMISSLVRNDQNISKNNTDWVGFEVGTRSYSPYFNFGFKSQTKLTGITLSSDFNLAKNGFESKVSHCALVYNISNGMSYLFINGEKTPFGVDLSSLLKLGLPNYEGIIIGARYFSEFDKQFSSDIIDRFFHGTIDNVRFYKDALTEDEVKEDMASEVPLSNKTVIAAYNFDELNDGRIIYDISGNGHDAQLMGDWPDYSVGGTDVPDERPIVNITQSEGGNVFVFTSGGQEIVSGSRIEAGSEIDIISKPSTGYIIQSVKANGQDLEFDEEGYSKTTIKENTSISAVFQKKSDVNQPAEPPIEETGIWPGHLSLDGNRYMKIPQSPEFNIAAKGSQTICFNVKLKDTNNGDTRMTLVGSRFQITSKGVTNKGGIEIYNDKGGLHGLYVYNAENRGGANHNAEAVVTTPLSSGQKHHVALVYDGNGGNAVLYLDGKESGRGSTSSWNVPNLASILIGCRYDLNYESVEKLENFAKGDFDDIHIYNTALSLEDILKDKNRENLQASAGLIAAYDFTEVKDKIVPDISGHGHNAYLMGNTWPDYKDVKLFTVNYTLEGNGKIAVLHGDAQVASSDKIQQGERISVSITPDEGYKLKSLLVNETSYEPNDNEAIEIEVTTDIQIKAIFEKVEPAPMKYAVTVHNVEHATVSLLSDNGQVLVGDEFPSGTVVTVSVEIEEGYELESILVNEEQLAGNSFVLTADSSIKVILKKVTITQHTVNYTITGAGSVTITVDDSPIESGSKIDNGKTLTIIAAPNDGYMLKSVSVNGTDLTLAPENVIKIQVDKDLDISITFIECPKKFFPVRVVRNEHVTVNMEDEVGKLSYSNELQEGTKVTVTAVPDEGYILDGIYVNDSKLEGNTFIVRGATIVEAKVSVQEPEVPEIPVNKYIVEYKCEGEGVLSIKNGDQDVVSGSELSEGILLSVKAIPESGWELDGLFVNGVKANISSNGIAEIEVKENITIIARFVQTKIPVKTYQVGIEQSEFGDIILSADGNEITSGSLVEEDTEISIRVIPMSGYKVTAIKLNGSVLDGTTFIVKTDCVVSADYEALKADEGEENPEIERYQVNFKSFGPGRIAVFDNEEELTSGLELDKGKTLSIKCFADKGARLVSLTVNGVELPTDYDGNAELVVNEATEINAIFEMIKYRLTVNTSGHGKAEVYKEIDDEGMPKGEPISVGDHIFHGDKLHLFAIPDKERLLISATHNNDGILTEMNVDEDFKPVGDDGFLYSVLEVKGDVVITLRFSMVSSGITGIQEDSHESRYFNMRGIEVPAENLVPGIYIKVTGKIKQKVLIK